MAGGGSRSRDVKLLEEETISAADLDQGRCSRSMPLTSHNGDKEYSKLTAGIHMELN